MKKTNRLPAAGMIVFLLAGLLSVRAVGQTDTLTPFSIRDLHEAMLRFHPVVKQAELLPELARQEIRMARGNFDPKLESRFSGKEYGGKDYYQKWATSVTLPTWFPVDPKIGLEQNSGAFLDPENQFSSADHYRQFFSGISVPVGRGLFIDDRRAALRQAQLLARLADADQVKAINKILLEAAKDYWQWYFTWHNLKLLERNVERAADIYRRVQLNTELGEAAVIDTVQARITLQSRQVEQQEATMELRNAILRLSMHLWDEAQNPVLLRPETSPAEAPPIDDLTDELVGQLLQFAKENHPEVVKVDTKLMQLRIDQKLASEYLKPRLDLGYYLLNQSFGTGLTLTDNYKLNVDFSVPLLLRKERSKLASTKVKIRQTQLEQLQVARDVANQLQVIHNQLVYTRQMLQQQRQIASHYERLLQAELLNLENGESDLFKINVQQEKLIQAQAKVIKLVAELEKSRAMLYWAAGTRNLSLEDL
ncbi:MAG: TolC family protein [Cyclobacteriaceae bacterium]